MILDFAEKVINDKTYWIWKGEEGEGAIETKHSVETELANQAFHKSLSSCIKMRIMVERTRRNIRAPTK